MRECDGAGGDGPKKLATAWLFSRTGGWRHAEYQCSICKEKQLYRKRNCTKFFPELVQIDRKPCWAPRVAVDGKRQQAIAGYAISECPVSYITAQSMFILELIDTAQAANKEGGAALFGPDASKHPAWWVDALSAVAGARAAYERAEYEAVKNGSN